MPTQCCQEKEEQHSRALEANRTSGDNDEWITRGKTLRQLRETENMRKHIFGSGYLGVSAPRMQDLNSLQSGEHSRYLQAHTGVPGARLEVVHCGTIFESPVFCLLTITVQNQTFSN